MDFTTVYSDIFKLIDLGLSDMDAEEKKIFLAHPDRYEKTEDIRLSQYAEILLKYQLEFSKKSFSTTVLASVKKILKSTKKSAPSAFHGVIFRNGFSMLADGYRLVRIKGDFIGLPHIEYNEQDHRFMDRTLDMVRQNATIEIELPTFTQLKQYIIETKKSGTPYELIKSELYVNAQYLADMFGALPKCKAYRERENFQKKPIYFRCENGNEGLLMPIRAKK